MKICVLIIFVSIVIVVVHDLTSWRTQYYFKSIKIGEHKSLIIKKSRDIGFTYFDAGEVMILTSKKMWSESIFKLINGSFTPSLDVDLDVWGNVSSVELGSFIE